MNFNINIQNELEKAREKHRHVHESLMKQVNAALQKGVSADQYLLQRLESSPKPGIWLVDRSKLDKNKVFSIDDIKAVCIKYRLRFLDSKYFRMENLPYDALYAIRELEKESDSEIRQTKIAAASGYFKLQDSNKDPLLFAQLDEHNYYLVFKWGKELGWYKKWLAYPMRNAGALFLTMLGIGIPFAFILPYFFWRHSEEIVYYQRLFFAAVTMYSVFMLVFAGFTFHKRFSRVCWNSPYFN